MNDTPICPCDSFIHPAPIFNRPGLSTVWYRGGDFVSFREALLRPLDGEQELRMWRPGGHADLAVQMLEWLAYLADILTFYNERIINQYYLRTADLPESVQRLVRILGYRPRPGIGAEGLVAALIKGPTPAVVPAGYQIQSKPGPGQSPQTFEVDAPVTAGLPDVVSADAPPDTSISTSLLLAGEVGPINPGELLLLVNRNWKGQTTDYAVTLTVKSTTTETDPRGKKNTRVNFASAATPPPGLPAQDFRLMRNSQVIGVYPYSANNVFTGNTIHLASLARQIHVGDPILIETSGLLPSPVRVTSYQELVWYANADDSAKPEISPNPQNKTPVPITHSVVGFTPFVIIPIGVIVTNVRFAWLDVGRVIAAPVTSAQGSDLTLSAAAGLRFPAVTEGQQLLLADSANDGATAKVATASASSTFLRLNDIAAVSTQLQAPINVLMNLLHVSRGKTVASEVLGSGDATSTGQEFVLQKAPLTYLASRDPMAPQQYQSTLRIFVDDVEWKEVPSFFGQAPNAAVFVTKEDEENKTHVQFGDGLHGARLPFGVDNVKASYRYESGAAVPDSGKLTVMVKPLPGLKAIMSPVPPAGGSEPDLPDRLCALAPRSVLTFNRAVSGNDYEVIAAQTPGVARARAYWAFDSARQQTLVTVYVGDTPGAVTAAQNALRRVMDPNRPLSVLQAKPFPLKLAITIKLAKDYLTDAVTEAVMSALVDPDKGLLGAHIARIGQTLFRSQIYEACLRLPGVAAVHRLQITSNFPSRVTYYRYFSGEGNFFSLVPADLTITVEAATDAS